MKRYIPALLLGAMIWNAAPAAAQSGPDYDMRFELTYTPLNISTTDPSGVCDASMNAVTIGGEGRIFRGIMFGGNYTRGGGNDLNLNGVDAMGMPQQITCSDPLYQDLKIYAKIPFNFESFADSDRVSGPRPAMSPFYGYIGYKNTNLSAKYPAPALNTGSMNAEVSSGFGFGLGADIKFKPLSLYGQVVYYPTMITKNIGLGVDGVNGNGYLRVWEWDVGLRSNFKNSPVQARVGYHFEQHQASNIKLQYDGIQVGASAEF